MGRINPDWRTRKDVEIMDIPARHPYRDENEARQFVASSRSRGVTIGSWKGMRGACTFASSQGKVVAMRSACVGFLLFAAVTAAQAHDVLLDQALARKALPVGELQDVIHTTTTVEGIGQSEIETETVDPRKDPREALASYEELRDVIGADARVVDRDAGRTRYAFTTHRIPRGFAQAGTVRVDMDDKSDKELFDGTATVATDAGGKPYVSDLDLHLHKPTGHLIARVKKLDISYVFVPSASSDAMVTTARSIDIDVRALFFVHGNVRSESELRRPPAEEEG